MIYSSGQLAFDANGSISGDVASQTRTTLANLAEVLAAHGCGLADVVKATIWLRNESDFAAFNEAYAAVFGEHRPARSTTIAGLAIPSALVEIEAIAELPQN